MTTEQLYLLMKNVRRDLKKGSCCKLVFMYCVGVHFHFMHGRGGKGVDGEK